MTLKQLTELKKGKNKKREEHTGVGRGDRDREAAGF